MSKVTDILTRVMFQAGKAVEKVAGWTGKKKSVRPKKTGLTDESGEDFSSVHWEERHIHTLLSNAERHQIFPLIPGLAGKTCLHLTPEDANYIDLMKKRGAENLVELDVRKTFATTESPLAKDHPFARGSVEKLPFKDEAFDFILYPSALAWRADLPNLIPEMARCLKVNGRFLISTVHPFFEYLMSPRGGFRKNIGTLFTKLKKSGFFVEDLRESPLDETLRHISLPPNLTQELRRFPGMPIVLLLRGILLKKRKSS